MIRVLVGVAAIGVSIYTMGLDAFLLPFQNGPSASSVAQSIEVAKASGDEYALRKSIDADANIVTFDKDDAGINAAKDKGRATLPRFFELMEAKTPGNYTIKTAIYDKIGNAEHVWVQLLDINELNFKGLIANEPVIATQYKIGDPITVPRNEVSDWMIKSDTAIYGGYTMRHMLDTLPKEQRDQFAAMLRD